MNSFLTMVYTQNSDIIVIEFLINFIMNIWSNTFLVQQKSAEG